MKARKYFLITLIITVISACTGFRQNPDYEKNIAHYNQNKDPQNDMCYINLVAANNDVKQLQYLLKRAKLNHNLTTKLGCTGNATGTPLGLAVANNAYDAAELLLKGGADPSDMGEDSDTPLMIAVSRKQFRVVELLLNYGAGKKLDVVETSKTRDAGAKMVTLFKKERISL